MLSERDFDEIDRLYQAILDWAENAKTTPIEVAGGIALYAQDRWTDFRELAREEAVQRALPIPDSNSSGKMIDWAEHTSLLTRTFHAPDCSCSSWNRLTPVRRLRVGADIDQKIPANAALSMSVYDAAGQTEDASVSGSVSLKLGFKAGSAGQGASPASAPGQRPRGH